MSKRELEITSALERAASYFAAHPGSPSAVRSPKLSRRCGVWVALLGRNLREGIAGMGPTVETALRAFDVHYLNTLRPPADAVALGNCRGPRIARETKTACHRSGASSPAAAF